MDDVGGYYCAKCIKERTKQITSTVTQRQTIDTNMALIAILFATLTVVSVCSVQTVRTLFSTISGATHQQPSRRPRRRSRRRIFWWSATTNVHMYIDIYDVCACCDAECARNEHIRHELHGSVCVHSCLLFYCNSIYLDAFKASYQHKQIKFTCACLPQRHQYQHVCLTQMQLVDQVDKWGTL
jgi:hypothetical protein